VRRLCKSFGVKASIRIGSGEGSAVRDVWKLDSSLRSAQSYDFINRGKSVQVQPAA
jgi:hypothetical protein